MEMMMRKTSQNQMAKYIFSLMMFCERTQSPLWLCPDPAAPMLGTEQLTSVGKAAQNGLTLTFCSLRDFC